MNLKPTETEMNLQDVRTIKFSDLELDPENPRISEFGITKSSSQQEILQVLWDEMAVNELIHSIVENGFWQYEPLIIIKNPDNDKFTVIEGNRRLAAVMLIHDQDQIDCILSENITDKITSELKNDLKELPVLEVQSREQSWKFVGFKHVNGPAKWGSYAKAKYIAEIHNVYDVPLPTIANQIGDTHNTVQKLYQGLMVLEQAENEKVFSRNNIQANRLFFSHLYTGLQRSGIQQFLNLKDASQEAPNPVPKENLKHLGELLTWLYGDTSNEQDPVIRSQNPDLKYLDEVLVHEEALSALRAGETLSFAHELSRPDEALLSEYLNAAKRNLQKASSYLATGYDGGESLLKTAGSIANIADMIYDKMDKQYKEANDKGNKKRMAE